MDRIESEDATWRGSMGEGSSGGGIGRIDGGLGDRRAKTDSKEAVWSDMLGSQSFNASGCVSERPSSSPRPPTSSRSTAYDLSRQSCPNPFVACDQSNTSNDLRCFDGCRK
jgi:hypothetical protein